MENTYGIGVTNRYSLFLDEEEDPLEVLKLQEQERETKRRSKIIEKESKAKNAEPKPKAAPIRKATKELQNSKVASTKPTESTKCKDETVHTKVASHRPKNVKFLGEVREVREERNNRRNRDERLHVTSDGIRDGPREGQGRGSRTDTITGTRDGPREGFGRGFRGNAAGGLRDGRSRGPRSDFVADDRREKGFAPRGSAARGQNYRGMSGNRGSYDIRVKRDFGRPFVTDQTEAPLSMEVPSNQWVAEPPAPTEVVTGEAIIAPAVADDATENLSPAEEEPHELTLDEYKALRSSRQKPTYNLRKAGEGEDLTQWKNMYELSKKKEEDEAYEEEAIEFDVLEYPQRVGRQKHVLNIDIHFTDGRRGSRGRGGRGGPRGSRGSGPRGGGGGAIPRPDEATRVTRGRGDHQGPAFRGERGMRFMSERGFRAERGSHVEIHGSRGAKQSAPKVDDEHDFPSLG